MQHSAEDSLDHKLNEYKQGFGEQFSRMLCLGMPNAAVVAIIEECLGSGKLYELELEHGTKCSGDNKDRRA